MIAHSGAVLLATASVPTSFRWNRNVVTTPVLPVFLRFAPYLRHVASRRNREKGARCACWRPTPYITRESKGRRPHGRNRKINTKMIVPPSRLYKLCTRREKRTACGGRDVHSAKRHLAKGMLSAAERILADSRFSFVRRLTNCLPSDVCFLNFQSRDSDFSVALEVGIVVGVK